MAKSRRPAARRPPCSHPRPQDHAPRHRAGRTRDPAVRDQHARRAPGPDPAVSAPARGAVVAAAADLHAGSLGLPPHRRRRHGERALREDREGTGRGAVRNRHHRRAGVAARRAAGPRRPLLADGRRPRAVARQRPVRRADDLCGVQPDLRGLPPRARPRHLLGLRRAGRRRPDAPDRAAVRHAPAKRRLLARGRRPVASAISAPARSRPASRCRRG